jgi:hypothetical protein
MKNVLLVLFAMVLSSKSLAEGYSPDKLSIKVAEAYCQSLVQMTKPQVDASQILANVNANIKGGSAEGKKVIYVSYKYNTPGAGYACAFFDYTRGRLQLAEFGEVWPDGNKNTIVNRLY